MADSSIPEKPALFVTTRWSVVLAARNGESDDLQSALGTLCGTYWRALYAYARRQIPPPLQPTPARNAEHPSLQEHRKACAHGASRH